MMYMPDAIRATIELMEAPSDKISIRTSYNVSALSFSPKEIGAEIQKHIPDFTMSYQPDYRQAIANSWPQSIDDSVAQKDWGWKPQFDLATMTDDMLRNLKKPDRLSKDVHNLIRNRPQSFSITRSCFSKKWLFYI
ncbi:hypothetical protein LWM68_11165 [Niabella sp. W65]|nr:hypothetical protein [Niabella sp. W65]MCH7363271.1 hypothetical protein [Niabella sp. W65]ULT39199.1 hypothetical protein KRR40_29905 [Niabella sp. I65]